MKTESRRGITIGTPKESLEYMKQNCFTEDVNNPGKGVYQYFDAKYAIPIYVLTELNDTTIYFWNQDIQDSFTVWIYLDTDEQLKELSDKSTWTKTVHMVDLRD